MYTTRHYLSQNGLDKSYIRGNECKTESSFFKIDLRKNLWNTVNQVREVCVTKK